MVMEPRVFPLVGTEECLNFPQGTQGCVRLGYKKDPSPQSIDFPLVRVPAGDKAKEIKLDLRPVHMPVIIHDDAHDPAPDCWCRDKVQDLYHRILQVFRLFTSDNRTYTN